MDPQASPTVPQSTQPTSGSNPPESGLGTPKTNTLAIWGFILSFLVPLAGLILAVVAKKHIKKSGESGSGLATAGIIISIAMIVVQFLSVIIWIFLMGAMEAQVNVRNSSNNKTTDSSRVVNTLTSTVDEKKALETSEAFLKAFKVKDFSLMYKLMGPDLRREYSGVSELQKQIEDAGIVVTGWKVEEVKTSGSEDRISVKGSLTLTQKPYTGKFEFAFIKDTDASVDMVLWQAQGD